jgi:hypothetical protein
MVALTVVVAVISPPVCLAALVLIGRHYETKIREALADAISMAGAATATADVAVDAAADAVKETRATLEEVRGHLSDPYGIEHTDTIPHLTPGQQQRADTALSGRHHRNRSTSLRNESSGMSSSATFDTSGGK